MHFGDCDLPRLQNSPYFSAYSSTREQSNKRSGTRLKTESERLARFALKTLTPRFTDFFTDFEKKNRLFCSLVDLPDKKPGKFQAHTVETLD